MTPARALIAALALVACEDPPRPWSAPPQRTRVDESRPFLPSSADDGWLGDAGLDEALDGGIEEAAEPGPSPRRESRVGGLFAACHEGFTSTNGPERDVTRLGLICGPPNGMKQLGDTVKGAVTAEEAATHEIEAIAGGCYRIFAVATGIADLELVVTTEGGTPVARDTTVAPWVVVDAERPFCTFDAATFQVSVGSRASSGKYALQVWQLSPSSGK